MASSSLSSQWKEMIKKAPEVYGITETEWKMIGNFESDTETNLPVQMLLLASLAYLDGNDWRIENWQDIGFKDSELKEYHFVERDRYQCFLMEFKSGTTHTLVISFRGTELPSPQPPLFHLAPTFPFFENTPMKSAFRSFQEFLKDWKTNIAFDFVPAAVGGRVHRGFSTGVEELWNGSGTTQNIKHYLDQFVASDLEKRIFITGHSQGAGMATIATSKLIVDSVFQRCALYLHAFAPPFVGDVKFVDNMNARATSHAGGCNLYRYTNREDPVPFLPPIKDFHPGPGTHFHLSGSFVKVSAPNERDAFFETRPYLTDDPSMILTNIQFQMLMVSRLIYHFPAGPRLLNSRPGYLDPLLNPSNYAKLLNKKFKKLFKPNE